MQLFGRRRDRGSETMQPDQMQQGAMPTRGAMQGQGMRPAVQPDAQPRVGQMFRGAPMQTQAPADPREEERPQVIGKAEIATALQTLREYQQGKANLDNRIIDNEQWFKLRHWEQIGKSRNDGDPEPTSAWLFNSIANKHADIMDNYPEPTVLAREASDEEAADVLSEILPVILKQTHFERTYDSVGWYKLKAGTGVYGVFWSPSKDNGLGDIDIRKVDLLNLYWEPGVTDIQKSRNLFHVELVDREAAEEMYPELHGDLAAPTVTTAKYKYEDSVNDNGKAEIIDWYYKRRNESGVCVLHYCKFCMGHVLYASENDPEYATRGFYDHGKYPFVFDVLFPMEGTPAGFGYIDVCKSPQMYIDKLDQVMLKHSVMGVRPRFWVRGDGKVNEEEYADWTKEFVHYNGSGDPSDSIFPITIPEISDIYVSLRSLKVDELKETSGNRDFSQGGTTSGVTAASAIAALQEAGSKLSRDMLKRSYDVFEDICHMCIDLMRQFYTETRYFRIIGNRGEVEYKQFSGRQIAPQPQGNDYGTMLGYRVPIFDVEVHAQKSSPFSTTVQNERAKELYNMGFFRPDLADQALAALDMMTFDGIENVRDKIATNGTLYEQVQQLTQQMAQMAQIIDAQNGTNILGSMGQGGQTTSGKVAAGGSEQEVNALGHALSAGLSSTAGAARTKAARMATPK